MDGEQIVPEASASAVARATAAPQALTPEELEQKIEESRQRALSKKREREEMVAKQKEVEELDFAIMHEVDLEYENAPSSKKKQIVKQDDSDDQILEMMQNDFNEDDLAGILDDEE